MRAIVLNATNMGVYDIAKGRVVDMTGWSRKDPRTVFCSSFLAGFFMTITVVCIKDATMPSTLLLLRFLIFLNISFFWTLFRHLLTASEQV
jgi:hypothetical protein